MSTVYIEGIRELNRAMRSMEKGARKEIRDELKGVGRIVAVEAESLARGQMVSRTGDLMRKIKPKSLARGISIEASAKHGGFNYPRRLEFDKKLGPRAFLYPAVDNKRAEAWEAFEKVMDWLEKEWERG